MTQHNNIIKNRLRLPHITLTAAFLLTVFPFSTISALAEQNNGRINEKFCSLPLPDPEELSQEEREWFTTFQEGTFYVQGWKEITEDILEKIKLEDKRETVRHSLNLLGIRIGCEWSKSNDVRKIDTDMLEHWGDKLQKTAQEQPEQLPVLITDIQQQVVELVQ